MFRLTSYVVYFSPLLETISSSLSPEVRKNFIMAANPYEVPWNSVAVHSIHRKVLENNSILLGRGWEIDVLLSLGFLLPQYTCTCIY